MRERQTQTQRDPLGTKSLCQRHHGTTVTAPAYASLMTQHAFPHGSTSRGRQRSNKLIKLIHFHHPLEAVRGQ